MPIESDCQLITALQRADAIRRACQHNVTGLEGKKLAHISDQRNDFMDHVRSRTLLAFRRLRSGPALYFVDRR